MATACARESAGNVSANTNFQGGRILQTLGEKVAHCPGVFASLQFKSEAHRTLRRPEAGCTLQYRIFAQADMEEVNEMWAGLGYYRRARYLLEGAKYVAGDLNGVFPTTSTELQKIPGENSWYTLVASTAGPPRLRRHSDD